MPVISHKLRLVFYDVPKVGCTSIKTALWEIENDRPFRQAKDLSRLERLRRRIGLDRGPAMPGIHNIDGYRTMSHARAQGVAVPEGYLRVTMVRDPAARLYSAWINKAAQTVFAQRGELEDLRNETLPLDPSFADLLDRFAAYRRVSRPVRVHTEPYAWHLGPDLAAYDRVFRLEDMAGFEAFLSERAGRAVRMPRRNSTETIRREARIEPRHAEVLRRLTAADYAWTGEHYDRDAGIERLMARIGPVAETSAGVSETA